MLRAKQIGTLSNCARSFLISGPRCSTPDGSSCTSTEDENSVSKKQHTRNDVILPQKPPTLVSKTSVRVGTFLSEEAAKVADCHDADSVRYPTSMPQDISAPSSLGRSDCVSTVGGSIDAVQNVLPSSSPVVSDQFVKVGIAAVGYLSDLVNYKIPTSDGGGILRATQNFVVNPTTSGCIVKPGLVKSSKRENFSKVSRKQYAETFAEGAKQPNCYQNTKGKGDNSGSVKGFSHSSRTGGHNPIETYCTSSDKHENRRSLPHKPMAAHPNNFLPNSNSHVHSSYIKFNKGIPKGGLNKHSRDTKIGMGFVPMGRQPAIANTGHVIDSVTRILRQLKWGFSAEEALGGLGCSMDAYQANQVLKQLQDHSVALGFFHWLKRQAGFRHDEHTYTTMVGILGRARQFGLINKLLNQMVRDGCQPNVVTYNRLIHSYGRANYLSDAVNVFNQMQDIGVAPDRVTYSTLIDIHAKAGFLDVAMYMYQRMQEAGLSPDTFTYSVIINCLGKAGHLNTANKLFCEMVNQGCVPNLVTYNIMIALQAKARNYPSALKLYRDMQAAGFEPDKVTYSIVMEVLGHCGYLKEAEDVFAEMKRKNWVPDEPVYGLLVDLWGKAGNVEKAWAWYQAMLNAGLCPNIPTCNSLLSAFLRVHRLSDAYHLLQSMLDYGLNPSLQTYTLLLSCCTDTQMPVEMDFCRQLMAITGHPAHMFLLSMPSAGPDGQNVRDHMSRFLDLMHSEDRESKRGLVDAVVDFLHKSGLKEEAGSVWEVAAHRNVYPDAIKEKSSCYWLINLHVMSDGTAVTALSRTLAWFRKEMLVSGIGPSRIDIVTGWGRRSRVTGTSLVRQAVQELLHIFSFPFFNENGNSGCFVGCGEPLSKWLHQSYVERMHLL